MIDFPQKLRSLRELRGWSQEELSKRLGVSRSKIGNYEQGTREPRFEDLEAIADVFNCTISFLIGDDYVGPEEYQMMQHISHNEETKELVNLFENADPVIRKAVLGFLKSSERNP